MVRIRVIMLAVITAVTVGWHTPALAEPLTGTLEIFSDHAAAIGYSLTAGSAKPYVIAFKTTWKDKNGEHTRISTEKHAGAYFYGASSRDGVGSTYGFDGRGFWRADEDGNVSSDIGYARPFDVTWSIIDSEAFDSTLTPEIRGEVGSDDVVRIHPSSGVPADIFFNRTTHYIDKVIVDPGRENTEEDYTDYQKDAGITIAMTRKLHESTTTVTSFKWNATLRADEFDRPGQRDYARFPAGGSTTLSFNPDKYPGIVVNASINGVQGRFLIDTGASGVFINPGFARRAMLQTFGHATSQTVGGYSSDSFARPHSFKLGDIELSNFNIIVPDRDFGVDEFDGLIGYSVLNQTVFAVDFDARKITFYDPNRFSPANAAYLVIALDRGTPQVQVTANTRVPVYMDLDLGASGVSFVFTKSFLDSSPGILQGGGRFVGGDIGTLAQLDLGPFQFYGLSAVSLTSGYGFSGEKVMQGLIGYEALRRFNMTFDYRSNKLYIVLNNYGNETKFGK